MRAVVGAVRWLIILILGLVIFGSTLAFFAIADGSLPLAGIWLLGSLCMIAVLLLTIGMVATFISLHDRHEELVEELRLIRTIYEHRGV